MRFWPDYSKGPWATQPGGCVYDWLIIAAVAALCLGLPALAAASRPAERCEVRETWRESDGSVTKEVNCKGSIYHANR